MLVFPVQVLSLIEITMLHMPLIFVYQYYINYSNASINLCYILKTFAIYNP